MQDQSKMKYRADISISENVDELYRCLLPEVCTTGRAKVNLKKAKDKLIIEIDAKDAVALRAMFTGMTKLLEVHEKVTENE
jgi:tRNA threonylcarbamoyladenosine modification (KEOPS) complex  Pcc1 subunit